MSGPSSAKELLSKYNKKQYKSFLLNNDEHLTLLVISSVPGIGASERQDTYKKTISHPGHAQHIKFITKNDEAHPFVWQTNPQQLKNAVRWGVIKTHSITSKVISSLGTYRIVAHERIAKGMMSNSQTVKLKLLDLFQDRFEALQELESLVNKDNSAADYEVKIKSYIAKLEAIQENLTSYFADVANLSGLNQDTIKQIKADLQVDIERAKSYLSSVSKQDNLRSFNRARGQNSILEFVKQQMIHGLYELQGINQDITYSRKRDFALTRGEMNDFIEDARKVIDDHQPDVRNAVTDKHHGIFSKGNEALVTYDFSGDELTPSRECEVLLAISFIEGWDKVDNKSLTVSNKYGTESLDVIHATKWKNHRNFTAFVKSVGYFILNFFKSILLPTQPWEEESWNNKNFHLVATELREHSTSNEPMWQKPIKLLKQIGYALFDVFKGVRNFGAQLSVKMPDDILNDWESCNELPSLKTTLQEAESEIADITNKEAISLKKILKQCKYDSYEHNTTHPASTFANVEYALTTGDQNDILTAMARGLNEFTSVFSHNLYAKDPIGGLVFTAAFAVGAGAIYLPNVTASVFGSAYVNWFSNFSYSMGSSKIAAVIGGGSTQAQAFATGWDGVINGPSGLATNALHRLGEDPLTVGAYLATATVLGYVLVNGIAGHPIPWLSHLLKEDLGSVPEASYPFIGGKFAVLLYEGFSPHIKRNDHHPELSPELVRSARFLQSPDPKQQIIIDRFILVSWLSKNAAVIPKLKAKQLFELSRNIEVLFDKDQSKSLIKLLYPEANHSIAYQLFSIPLSYIPALLRFVTALILSAFALGSDRSHPFEPIKRTATHLYEKISKDLSRLIVFVTHLAYLAYTGLAMAPKAIAYTLTMLISRIASLFDTKPAHAIYKYFGSLHTFFRTIGEFFYPAKTLKNVEVANPIHTIKEVECSYTKLLGQMNPVKPVPTGEFTAEINPDQSDFSLTSKARHPERIFLREGSPEYATASTI